MKKVLVVDDEWEIRKALEYFLEKIGCQSILAGSSDDALVKIKTEKPDLILLDYFLPGIDGPEFIDLVKMEAPHTPIFLITAYDQITHSDNKKELGVDDIISKPFDLNDLEKRIKTVLLPKE